MLEKIRYPSPNFDVRTEPVKYVILHGTWMGDDDEALQRLSCPVAKVSAHYFIDKDGRLLQMVDEDKVAWHAGVSAWREDVSLNQTSIGIEISALSHAEYNEAQYQTLERLLADVLERYSLSPDAVLAHSDVAPRRKDDPGRGFDWARLEILGLAFKNDGRVDVSSVDSLRAYGYRGDDASVLEAASLRWR